MFRFGGIAQLGERLTGSQEVSGSIPLISTKEKSCNCNGYKAFSFSPNRRSCRISNAFLTLGEQAYGQLNGHVLLAGGIQMPVDVGGHFDVDILRPFLHILLCESCVEQAIRENL